MNRGIGYVQVGTRKYLAVSAKLMLTVPFACSQGMNEIIGPIYYVFAQHPDEKQKGM